LLFEVGEQMHVPRTFAAAANVHRRQGIERVVMLVQRQAHLLQIVLALRPPRGFASRLHRRQEQGDQHADNGDHDQQLHQRESRHE
jgi:hypothetical protein